MNVAEIFEKASGKLPTIPKVVHELIASFRDVDLSVDDLADKIGHDQVLTARVLRLANSARFGGNRTIGTLHDAVILLGIDNLKMLVIASGITSASKTIPGFNIKAFWERSFEMANTSRCLANFAKLDPQLAYTCGLLCNIGELVLHVALPNEALQIDKMVAGGANRVTAERVIIGMDLTQIGAELAARWNFPDTIQEAIREQHNFVNSPSASPYTLLIGIASLLVAGFNNELNDQDMLTLLPGSTLAQLGILPEQLREAMSQLKEASTLVDELL